MKAMSDASVETESMKLKNNANFNSELPIPPVSMEFEENPEMILNDNCVPVKLVNSVSNSNKDQKRVECECAESEKAHNDEINTTETVLTTETVDNEEFVYAEPGIVEELLENSQENLTAKSNSDKACDDDVTNKVIFNLEGLKETKGLLYLGYKEEVNKTNPSKIVEWFTPDFLNLHGVYAIKEEEPFLLRVFTRNHESTNRGIRKKGGRKVMLMGQEVFGDVLLACGHCGYWSHEGSNVRRHLKKSVCLKERGYTKEDLVGLDRIERRKFLRRLAAAKCRAKKKAKATAEGEVASDDRAEQKNLKDGTSDFSSYSLSAGIASHPYPECLVEIQENRCGKDLNRVNGHLAPLNSGHRNRSLQAKVKKKPPKYRALSLGPAVVQEVVQKVPYDIYTLNENNERIAWKPPSCHKCSPGGRPCQIVFKGVRMKRRCLDLPIPLVLIYRKLDCRVHHCNFTLFHPSARDAFKNDPAAKASVNIKLFGEIVMTKEFYHYFVSLLSVMKMKSSQTARHLTSVWETIITERLGVSSIPDEHRKVITLSKQTVKSIWSSIEDEAGSKAGVRLTKAPKKKKKAASQTVPAVPPPPPPPDIHGMNHHASLTAGTCGVAAVQVSQPGMQHHCMKRLNHIPPKPPPPPKPPMMAPPPPPPPPPPPHNHMQQPPHAPVSHAHWLSQGPQYPHNMTPYPMAPPPTAEYYPMPGHFMAQYTPATMGTSP